MRLPTQLAAIAWLLAGSCADAMASLPPQDAPTPHWPWWLRVLAVIGALAFVQIVARSLRKGAGPPGPGPTGNDSNSQ